MLRYLAVQWSTWRITTYIKERIDHPKNEIWVAQLTNQIRAWNEWPRERKSDDYIRSVILRMYAIPHGCTTSWMHTVLYYRYRSCRNLLNIDPWKQQELNASQRVRTVRHARMAMIVSFSIDGAIHCFTVTIDGYLYGQQMPPTL